MGRWPVMRGNEARSIRRVSGIPTKMTGKGRMKPKQKTAFNSFSLDLT